MNWITTALPPDPASRRMVLLWLASPLSIGTQCIVGFYDHTFGTWRDMDGHVVQAGWATHWAETPEGPV